MEDYPFLNLPDHYTRMLRMVTQGFEFNSNTFSTYVYENRELLALIETHFSDIDSELRLEAIFKNMTWKGIRNRLARLFIHYEIHHQFSLSLEDESHIKEMLSLEEQLQNYHVEGTSRVFLLLFYFKMKSIKFNEKNAFGLKSDIIDFFKYSKARNIRIDWLYILLDHFYKFFGRKKLLSFLEDRLSYADIYAHLTEDQIHELTANLLSYGSSIGEADIFTSENALL